MTRSSGVPLRENLLRVRGQHRALYAGRSAGSDEGAFVLGELFQALVNEKLTVWDEVNTMFWENALF